MRTAVVFGLGWLAAAIPAALFFGALFARRDGRPRLPVGDGSSGAGSRPPALEQPRERSVGCHWCGRDTWNTDGCCDERLCVTAEHRYWEKRRHPTAVKK